MPLASMLTIQSTKIIKNRTTIEFMVLSAVILKMKDCDEHR